MQDSTESHRDATASDESTSIGDFEMLDRNDGEDRDETEVMESGVGAEHPTLEMEYSPTSGDWTLVNTASATSDDGTTPERSGNGLGVTHPGYDCTMEVSLTSASSGHAVFDSGHLGPSELDLDVLNSFVHDPRHYPGVDNDDDPVANCGNGHPALSERSRSESPSHSEPRSRASTAEPTREQTQFGYGAVHEFKSEYAVDGKSNNPRRDLVSPLIARFLSDLGADAAAGAGP
ncbi:hypothetical protein GGTG_11925 [Gaeumannomyces tritici R3-111a-1]|uniref:Uncharacterized protein n=1 Tax=Gaeumannomyces tritici (strain R3-111a-1) TaxID=644352 RepID=J3PEJ4_GAET3|nr:hypothetical protein GGTG_11925 [Gaeumannomyces tritici R3-111a-1]EJT70902.1 hypothetical protein GGTG_11925 [Gaeumannomyces tritici R3-111a-1]